MPKNTNGLARPSCLLLALLLSTGIAIAQGKVTGRVMNQADNQPVPGATITLKATRVIVQSGADGSFSINLPSGSGTLLITAVGFVNEYFAIPQQQIDAENAGGKIMLKQNPGYN